MLTKGTRNRGGIWRKKSFPMQRKIKKARKKYG